MALDITLGNILTILSVIIGLIVQYTKISIRFSRFEGYITAKVESLEKDVDKLWDSYRELEKVEKVERCEK